MLALSKGSGDALDTFNSSAGRFATLSGNYALTGIAIVADDEADSEDRGESAAAFMYSKTGYPLVAETGGTGLQIAGSFYAETAAYARAFLAYNSGEAAILTGGSTSTHPTLRISNIGTASDAIEVSSNNGLETDDTFLVQGSPQDSSGRSQPSSNVQVQGNVFVTGSVYSGCTAFPAPSSDSCAATSATTVRTRSGQVADAFTSRNASPTIEDEGEAELVGGYARVTLNPTFAAAMSDAHYLVFTTPRGDSHGVYVSNATASGFDVRENSGGRSTMAFDYRIVAKAVDATLPRMAMHVDRAPMVTMHPFLKRSHSREPQLTRILERAKSGHAQAIDVFGKARGSSL